MKDIKLGFNRERLSYAFRFDKPECTIKVTNIYVHSPNEASLNKKSIAWSINSKPYLKLTLDNGADKFERRLDISALRGVFDGYPLNGGILNSYTEINGKTTSFSHGEMEFILDSKFGIPDISVDMSSSPGVEVLEEVAV